MTLACGFNAFLNFSGPAIASFALPNSGACPKQAGREGVLGINPGR